MGRADHLKRYQFQPGHSGGPGRPPLPTSEKEVRKFTREHVSEIYNKIIEMNRKELDDLLNDPEVPSFEKAVARCVISAETTGAIGSLENVLERIIGKVPQKSELELSGAGGSPLPPVTWIVEGKPVPPAPGKVAPVGSEDQAGSNNAGT